MHIPEELEVTREMQMAATQTQVKSPEKNTSRKGKSVKNSGNGKPLKRKTSESVELPSGSRVTVSPTKRKAKPKVQTKTIKPKAKKSKTDNIEPFSQQCVDEDRRRSGKKNYTDYTTVDNTSVVSKAIKIVDCFANQIATVFRIANFSSQPTKTPNIQKKIINYLLSGIRRYLHSQEFSGKTTKILSKS